MYKILITNDDGIMADGIRRLAEAASRLGEVWVVAPEKQCSAMSHRVTLHSPIEVYPVSYPDFPVKGVHAYAATGTPADCIRFGVPNIVKTPPDIVFSGINYGYNCGTDIQYSATIGAAMEAACMGIPAIAFSEGSFAACHEVTDAWLSRIMEDLSKRPLAHNQIWNVNFPNCPLAELKGILENRTVADNAFYLDSYIETPLPNGRIRLDVCPALHENAAEGTDFRAIVDKYISIGVVNNLR